MLVISATDEWRAAHRGGAIGLLELSGIDAAPTPAAIGDRKRETEARLRARYQGLTRQDFSSLPVMAAYVRYYKRFGKTYHVELQLESIVLKGKSLPDVTPLVDANFVAEVETFVLTAGHDAAKLDGAVAIDAARDGDAMTQMNGALKPMLAGDMIMRDGSGVSCSIVYGQDNRSPISRETSHVLYVAYAPTGVGAEAVEAQLAKIEDNVRLFAPKTVVEQHRVLSA